jgi:hypothetical protein
MQTVLAGFEPFRGDSATALINKVTRGEYIMSRRFSPQVRNLIAKMLVVDPAKRITLDGIMADPWFRVGFDVGRLLERDRPDAALMAQRALQRAHERDLPEHRPDAPLPARPQVVASADS